MQYGKPQRNLRAYGGYVEAFMETLTEKEQDKIQYGLLLLKTQERLSTKFVKFVQDGVFELLNSSSKCNGIHINNLFKFFVWCEVSKSFTRSII